MLICTQLRNMVDPQWSNKKYLNSRFELRLTKAERELLAAKAKKAGISSGEFVRKIICDTEVREAPSADVKELLRLMRRIGGNINQLLHRANTVGFIDTVQLRKDLVELREVRQMIVAAYNIKSGRFHGSHKISRNDYKHRVI